MNSTKQAVEAAKDTYADDFLVTLADKLGAVANAKIVFAEPIEREGVTVIPVAKARWGFGGGSGRTEKETGSGGGGGAVVSPIGFIEIRNGEAIFKRIHTVSPFLLTLGGVVSLLLLGGLFNRR